MLNLKLGNISINGIGPSAGFFIGKKNTHKAFHSEKTINEVVGVISGNENQVTNNHWVKNRQFEKEE
jgi:hypothetical protein